MYIYHIPFADGAFMQGRTLAMPPKETIDSNDTSPLYTRKKTPALLCKDTCLLDNLSIHKNC